MEHTTVTQLYQLAEENLRKAQDELYRPSHDVVKIAGCMSARQALHQLLACVYLMHNQNNNGQDVHQMSLKSLIDFSKNHDVQFQTIDFEVLQCSSEVVPHQQSTHYCNDINLISSCAKLAENVQEIVIKMIHDTYPIN